MKRILALVLTVALLLPMVIGGMTLRSAASTPTAGKYVITGGGVLGAPSLALNTTTYTGAEIGTMLAATDAVDSGVVFNADGTAVSAAQSYVVELVPISGDVFAIKLNNGRYLTAAGSTNLISIESYQANADARWKIDVANGEWTITNERYPDRYLGYSVAAHYFRTFTTGGQKPFLYRWTQEQNSDSYTVTMHQSANSYGTGSITATYDGQQFYYPEHTDNLAIPTVFRVAHNARVTLFFEPAEGCGLSMVRVNGIERNVTPSGNGYSLVLPSVTSATSIVAVWVGEVESAAGDPSTAVEAPYDNATYDLEGIGSSDPITTARVDTAAIVEGGVFTDKSVSYLQNLGCFQNELSLASIAYQTAHSEEIVIPMDLIVVLDISGSMNTEISGSTNRYRMTEIVEAINDMTETFVNVSNENRIGMVTYSGGTSTGTTQSNAETVISLARHESIQLTYTNQNSGDKKSGTLQIRADNNTVSRTVTGGTYTQTGLAKAYDMFAAMDSDDRMVTINGQEYERTPVIILLTDGVPTWANSTSDTRSFAASNTGNGAEADTAANGNACYYTVRTAQYIRQQMMNIYTDNERFRFYTLGVDMSGADFTYAKLAAAVLNPNNTTIGALSTSNTSQNAMRTGLNSTDYRNKYYKDGQYQSYANQSYDIATGTDQLLNAFREILTEAQAVITQLTPILDNTTVDFSDWLGRDMEFKSAPILNYNGRDYAHTSTSQEGGKTYYHYSGTVQAFDGGADVNLADMVVYTQQEQNGLWGIHWQIPAALVPSYVYNEQVDAYIPAETARLRYNVAPTNAALAQVTTTRTFYSNCYDEAGYHARVDYQLNPDSPFYRTYHSQVDQKEVISKCLNQTDTDGYIVSVENNNGEIDVDLGNNGKLTVSAKRADITVKKLWKNPDGSICDAPEGASVVGQLWRKTDGAHDTMIGEQTLSPENDWQYTWNNLVLRDENHTYSYYGKEVTVYGANAYDYYTVEEPDENGELRISNYYNRMTITLNTDWYYNGVNETDTYENRTVNTLYYKDATGSLVPVSGVEPIVFDATDGLPEDWNDRWTDLFIRNPDGTPIEYVVEQQIVNEDLRGEHTTFYTVDLDPATEGANPREPYCDSVTGIVNPDPVVQIDNYLENPPITVTVHKVWSDNTGNSQDDITVSLYRSPTSEGAGTLVKTATFGKAENWTYTFTELAPGYYYYVREAKVNNYMATYSGRVCQATDGNTPVITVTNAPYPTTGLTVEKIWQTGSGTVLLDASNMPPVTAKVWQKAHTVTEIPEYTVTFRFYGRTNNSTTNRTVATEKRITGVKWGSTATLDFTAFNNLRLSDYTTVSYANVTASLSGTGTLSTDSFTKNVTTSGSTYNRSYYMTYGGNISVSNIQSDIVVTVLCNRINGTNSTFGTQNATLAAAGGREDADTRTEMFYQPVTLSANNDWHVSLENLPTVTESEDGFTTTTYTYYVQEEESSYEPVYSSTNDPVNGITKGVISITNTIHPEILPDQYVYDFGLPLDASVLDNDEKSLNINGIRLTGVSTTAPAGVAVNTGVSTRKLFGSSVNGSYGGFSIMGEKLRFTPTTTNVPGIAHCWYEIFVPGVGYMYSYVDFAPASNVHFEESFLANSGFSVSGAADARVQSDRNTLYGNDDAYAAYEEESLGRGYYALVSDPNVQPTATFTFTGTGFDIISRSTPASGVMVVEAHENNANGEIVKRFITDTYLAEDSLYQLPVVHCTDLPYGTYFVTVKAYYNSVFDHNLQKTNQPKTRGASVMAGVLKDLGWPADAEYVYTAAEPVVAPAKRGDTQAQSGSYTTYIDGIRIYHPLDASPDGIGGTLYSKAKETGSAYIQIRKSLLDAQSWNSTDSDVVDAVMYIADKSATVSPSEEYLTTGVYLSTNGTLRTVVEDGKTYLLDVDGNRIQFNGEDVWTVVDNGVCTYYHGQTELTQQELNTLELCYYDDVYRARGPENEAYLANGNGIAFAVDANTGVQISAKSPNGKPVSLCVYDGEKWNSVATLTSATEMFYDLTPYIANSNQVIVKCVTAEADGILSLCQVKLIEQSTAKRAAKRAMAPNAEVVYAATQALENGTENLLAHEHIWMRTANTATCYESGIATETCTLCGKERTRAFPALGHTYSVELTPVVSCVSDGSMVFTCTQCGESVTRILPRERHHFVKETVPAADGNLAYDRYSCAGCGFSYTLTQNPCASKPHSFTYTDNLDGYHTAVCEDCGMADFQAHCYENGACVCGAEPHSYEQVNLAFAQLILNESIDVVFSAEVPADCERVYMKFSFRGEEYTVNNYTVDDQDRFCFAFTNIAPQYMNDIIHAEVYCTAGGENYVDKLDNFSVKTYCTNLMTNYPDNAKLQTLLSDLLVYGAAAQEYTGYQTDALVTDGLTLTPSTFPEEPTSIGVSFTGEQDSGAAWTAASLILKNNLTVRFEFKAESLKGLTAQVALNDRVQSFNRADFKPVTGKPGTWYIEFSGVQATEFDDAIYASFFRTGENIGKTVAYSVNSYVCRTYDNAEAPTLARLVKALYNYGCSASAYAE